MAFLNRRDELTLLRDRVHSGDPELLVVYGRRRVGKTELLSHLAGGVRSIYVEATNSVEADQLRDISDDIGRVAASQVLAAQPLTSWPAVLASIAELARGQRLLVVFDEFQYLARRSPQLESTLSRWWRTTGRHLSLMLVLAGSEISFFEDDVLAGQLYGRRTGQLKVGPFSAHDAALFHPSFDAEDRVRAFSICGGVPYYLERFDGTRRLASQLLGEVFERTGLLHEEAELMLRQSLADPSPHIAVLRALAHGHDRNNEIGQRTRLGPAHVTKLLDTLERLGLVDRLRPVTASARAKKTAYVITDQFLRFHFRFLEPARSQLRTRALAAAYVRDTVMPQLDHHASSTWKDVCREYVAAREDGVVAVGRWWGQVPTGEGRRTEEREIDVVGVDAQRRPVVVGMCKWTNRKVDVDELNLLDRLAARLEAGGDLHRYLFSRSGFTARLRTLAAGDPRLVLVTPPDIYA